MFGIELSLVDYQSIVIYFKHPYRIIEYLYIIDQNVSEINQHLHLCEYRQEMFQGRDEIVDRLKCYVQDKNVRGYSITLLSYNTQLHYSITLLKYTIQLQYSILLLNYITQLHYSITLLNYTTQLHYSITLLSYHTQLQYSITLLNYTTQLHYSITLLSYTTKLHSSVTLLG